jgi:hypothetical protein
MKNPNVFFSGCQVFHIQHPFQYIRRAYGDVKVCVVKFWSTTLLVDEVYREYSSLILKPIVDPNPDRIRVIIPKMEIINGQEDNWENAVVRYIKSDSKKTLVVMEGVHWPEECRIHKERVDRIIKILCIC